MSTRSVIARRNADQSISAVYCHYDGYPEGVGSTLVKHWTDPAKVDQLIALGAVSVLDEEVGEKHDMDWRSGHWFDLCRFDTSSDREDAIKADARNKWTRFYSRDRGDSVETTEVQSYTDEERLFAAAGDGFGAEYVYIFNPESATWKGFSLTSSYNVSENRQVEIPVKSPQEPALVVAY